MIITTTPDVYKRQGIRCKTAEALSAEICGDTCRKKDPFRRCTCRRYPCSGRTGWKFYCKSKGRKQMIPKDPMILLSYVNTQLRDYYDSLEALCTCRGMRKKELVEKMDAIDYHYDEETNQFI